MNVGIRNDVEVKEDVLSMGRSSLCRMSLSYYDKLLELSEIMQIGGRQQKVA